ncbi:hypothetical protein M3Y99_00710200 [Aphelenchoides fujianensis]|nr:hypothetical protein M3Y99_00710200 [Aphelenchoides fujianensis]
MLCGVCGSGNAARHYGGTSCVRCRSFFRRSLRTKAEFRCEERGECAISADGRRQCRACRFERCLQAGLNPKLVHSDRFLDGDAPERHRRRLKANAQRFAALELTVDADETKKLTMEFDGPLGFRSSIEVADGRDVRSVLRFLAAVDGFVAQFSEGGFSPSLPDCRWPSAPPRFDLQLDVAEALLVATRRLSVRSKMVWRADHWLALESFTPLWCRGIVHYADLISHVPEFRRLDAADQCRLGVGRLFSLSTFDERSTDDAEHGERSVSSRAGPRTSRWKKKSWPLTILKAQCWPSSKWPPSSTRSSSNH